MEMFFSLSNPGLKNSTKLFFVFQDLPLLPNGKIDYAKLVRPEEEIDITPYFSREELDKMGHLETSRYKNMVMNYEVMLRMGKKSLRHINIGCCLELIIIVQLCECVI